MFSFTKKSLFHFTALLVFTSQTACQTLADKSGIYNEARPPEEASTSNFETISFDDLAQSKKANQFRVGDTVGIRVYNVENLNGEFVIDQSGNVDFPLIGTLQVAGLTTNKLQEQLTDRYGSQYLQSPNIIVTMESQDLGQIVVDGAVNKPGVYDLDEFVTLSQAVAMAEGITRDAKRDEVFMVRNIGGERKIQVVNLQDIQFQGAKDPQIIPGDAIFIQESTGRLLFNDFVKTLPLLNSAAILSRR